MLTVAIDGPAGAGKSSVARRVADTFGYTYIDTGAMYRAIAWKGTQLGLAPEDAEALSRVAAATQIAFRRAADGTQRVYADGADVTEAIRTPEITRLSSPVSAVPGVRSALVRAQQAMGHGGGVVMEGRDIGTVVFPRADVKVYLDASEEERARRRWGEMQAKGMATDMAELLARQRERDRRDSTRADSPLRAAPDAVRIDTNDMSMEEVVEAVVGICRARLGGTR